MTEVVIVARTRIGAGVCVGGLTLSDSRNVRLMTASGDYQSSGSPFEVGRVYDLSMAPLIGEAPHVENVRVTSMAASRTTTVMDLATYLRRRVHIVVGGPTQLFDGKLRTTSNHRPYIGRGDLPGGSVEFWQPDADLVRDGTKYVYRRGLDEACFTYAGVADAVPVISAGSLVRMSLATWWPDSDPPERRRCYTQVSGCFS